MTSLSIIVAVSKNGVIGVNNTLPWHLPEDLKRFKALTMGHHIVMGRKTFESLGRLLPGRTSVIVSRNRHYQVEGAIVVASLEEAMNCCKDDDEAFLIGGAQMYQVGISLADKLYITEVDVDVDGDAYMPEIDYSQWELQEKVEHISSNGLKYCYLIYSSIK
jgi:dihydrofolate reductase